MIRLLFLSTGNSCRSQMAEGFAKAKAGSEVTVHSAGVEADGLHPLAIKTMAEAGIDIAAQKSKAVSDLGSLDFDVVITVCDHAERACPLFPGDPVRVHWNILDPTATGSEERCWPCFGKSATGSAISRERPFDLGYLSALVETKRKADLILDNITDGIIAHD